MAWRVHASRYAEVPDLKGMHLDEANECLRQVGLEPGPVTQLHHGRVLEGVVISQNTAPGQKVRKGWMVSVTVSLGPPPAEVVVPNVTGMLVGDAIAALGHYLTVGIPKTVSSPQPNGTVLSQVPAAGSIVPTGSAVDLVVSMGEQGSTSYTPGSVKITAVTSSRLTAYLLDADGEKLIYDARVQKGEEVTLTFRYRGLPKIRYYFDGARGGEIIAYPKSR